MPLLVAIVVAACGRVGFDPETGMTPDTPADTADDTSGYCARIPALATAPVIDGELDGNLALAAIVPVDWSSREPLPAVDAQLAIAWRATGLYFFVVVDDADRHPAPPQSHAYCGDGVELYADADGAYPVAPDYDRPGTRQFVAVAPANASDARSDGSTWEQTFVGAWSGGFVAAPRPTGYVLEAFIEAAQMDLGWELQPGSKIGFDVSINVSTTDGSAVESPSCVQNLRLGQYFLRVDEASSGTDGRPYNNVRAFCTATLE